MPDRDVKTIRDLIYYQYTKIIAKWAFSAAGQTQIIKLIQVFRIKGKSYET